MIGPIAEPEENELPIFELPLAIVPGEQTPLHIFEPRYRRMTAHCLEEEVPFGIVFRDDAGARAVGCAVDVAEVLERYEDGRLDIVVRGADRFRVLDRFEAPDWPAATVEMIDDGPGAPMPGSELAAARAAFGELLESVGAEPERAAGASTSYEIAAQIEMPAVDKQALLERDDELERLDALEAILRRLIGGLKRTREIAERAKSNGHGQGRIGPIGSG